MRILSSKSIFDSPERLAILLALADGPNIAPAIAEKVIADTMGHYIQKTSLYRHLHQLEHKGYLKGGPVYSLTPKSWKVLEQELHRAKHYHQLLQVRLSPHQFKS
jgi:DNA-binding PadR family transcriptional regulator